MAKYDEIDNAYKNAIGFDVTQKSLGGGLRKSRVTPRATLLRVFGDPLTRGKTSEAQQVISNYDPANRFVTPQFKEVRPEAEYKKMEAKPVYIEPKPLPGESLPSGIEDYQQAEKGWEQRNRYRLEEQSYFRQKMGLPSDRTLDADEQYFAFRMYEDYQKGLREKGAQELRLTEERRQTQASLAKSLVDIARTNIESQFDRGATDWQIYGKDKDYAKKYNITQYAKFIAQTHGIDVSQLLKPDEIKWEGEQKKLPFGGRVK